jgi:hypothetical protein
VGQQIKFPPADAAPGYGAIYQESAQNVGVCLPGVVCRLLLELTGLPIGAKILVEPAPEPALDFPVTAQ